MNVYLYIRFEKAVQRTTRLVDEKRHTLLANVGRLIENYICVNRQKRTGNGRRQILLNNIANFTDQSHTDLVFNRERNEHRDQPAAIFGDEVESGIVSGAQHVADLCEVT